MLNQQPHQALGVEDELVPGGVLVPVGVWVLSSHVANKGREHRAALEAGGWGHLTLWEEAYRGGGGLEHPNGERLRALRPLSLGERRQRSVSFP